MDGMHTYGLGRGSPSGGFWKSRHGLEGCEARAGWLAGWMDGWRVGL